MRETHRRNRDRFPAEGAVLFVVKSLDDEELVKTEMLKLSQAVIKRPLRRPTTGNSG